MQVAEGLELGGRGSGGGQVAILPAAPEPPSHGAGLEPPPSRGQSAQMLSPEALAKPGAWAPSQMLRPDPAPPGSGTTGTGRWGRGDQSPAPALGPRAAILTRPPGSCHRCGVSVSLTPVNGERFLDLLSLPRGPPCSPSSCLTGAPSAAPSAAPGFQDPVSVCSRATTRAAH